MDSPVEHSRYFGLNGFKKQEIKTTDENSVNFAALF